MPLSIEENVKLKIVLDFLKSLGFQEDELSFESGFHLSLGRYTYRVDTEKQCRESEPRLDILVTRNNNNLFVVEVKSDLVKISQGEIGQATSYARLVHPVAPYAIVTNGKEFHIYDTLTRVEVETTEFKIRERYEVSITEEYRYEALKHFIGYSHENVKRFCQKQVLEGMKTLLGSKEQPQKKFVPELHSQRKGLRVVINEFLKSGQPAFALTGDSGTGKTCSMCATALELMNGGCPVLFYRARDLVHGVAKSIAEDFNWEFTSEYSEIQVFKRITELFGDEQLTVFIDAIDEWNLPNKVEILGNFLRQTTNRKLKVILSCKTALWDIFLNQGGMPTYLSEVVYKIQDREQGYRLQPMTGEEFHHAVENYRRFYSFKGRFEDKVLEECKRNPFLLRVFFEVAHNLGLRDLTFSSIEFFDAYYNQTLDKLGNREVADATIKAVAKCLLERDATSVGLDVVRKYLGLNVNGILMPALFDFNILEITGDSLNSEIAFYFERFRDYIISHHVMKFQEIPLHDFVKSIEKLHSNQSYQQALKFFYPVATQDRQSVIDGEVRKNAEAYLNLYVEVIENHFPNLKSRFSPHTEGDIGFLGELALSNKQLTFYGFRPLTEKDNERVKFIPIDTPISRKRSNVSYLHGATYLHWTGASEIFKDINVKEEVLINEIGRQLKDIVRKGLLNESDNPYLLLEKVTAIVAKYQAKHHGIKDIRQLGQYLPIDFDTIEYALRYERAVRIYHDELIEQKRKEGLIKETWKGSTVSFGYSLSEEDKKWIRDKAEDAARNNIYVESDTVYVEFDEADKTLPDALFYLRRRGVQAITEPIIPDIDNERVKWIWNQYSYETWGKYIERIYCLFLDEYYKLVKTNFTSLAEHFSLYSCMPVRCFIVVEESNDENTENMVTIYQSENKAGSKNEVTLCDKEDLKFNTHTLELIYSGQTHECFCVSYPGVSHFILPIRNHINFPVNENLIILRSLVYTQIEGELNSALDSLLNQYGIKHHK